MLYRNKRPLLVFVLPSFLLMLIFLYYPFFVNIFNSLFDIRGLAGAPEKFLGADNYKRFFFGDPTGMTALKNSLAIMGLAAVFQVGIAVVLAVLVDSLKRARHFFRVVYFFPIVISATAIGLMFSLFYHYDGGMLNQILARLGVDRVLWLSKDKAFWAVSTPVLWQYVGFYFVILLTGLSDIPEEIFESAAIDGVSPYQKVRFITLPMLRGVLITCVTLAVTGAIKVFDLPAVIARNGAPNGLTYFLGTYMHNQAFVAQNVDYASTVSVVIVALGVLAAQTVGRVSRRERM